MFLSFSIQNDIVKVTKHGEFKYLNQVKLLKISLRTQFQFKFTIQFETIQV